MQEMQDAGQTQKTEQDIRSEEMNGQEASTRTRSAPLYASPWLAFFYLIRQGWTQLWP